MENRSVVPARIISVKINRHHGSRRPAAAKPVIRNAAEAFIGLLLNFLLQKESILGAHFLKCPGMDRRLGTVKGGARLIYVVRIYAAAVLIVHKNLQLSPCQLWLHTAQCNPSKAVIPAPDIKHPVL